MPKIGPGHVDGDAVQIRSALNVPKSNKYTNEQIRQGGRSSLDGEVPTRSPYKQVSIRTLYPQSYGFIEKKSTKTVIFVNTGYGIVYYLHDAA